MGSIMCTDVVMGSARDEAIAHAKRRLGDDSDWRDAYIDHVADAGTATSEQSARKQAEALLYPEQRGPRYGTLAVVAIERSTPTITHAHVRADGSTTDARPCSWDDFGWMSLTPDHRLLLVAHTLGEPREVVVSTLVPAGRRADLIAAYQLLTTAATRAKQLEAAARKHLDVIQRREPVPIQRLGDLSPAAWEDLRALVVQQRTVADRARGDAEALAALIEQLRPEVMAAIPMTTERGFLVATVYHT
jgi:hypothetical protein